jgi:hypothetical protein
MQPYHRHMFRQWFNEGIEDRDEFRRRFRWALALQWLVESGVVLSILLTR